MHKQHLAKGKIEVKLGSTYSNFQFSDFGQAGLCNCDNRSISSDSGILTSVVVLAGSEDSSQDFLHIKHVCLISLIYLLDIFYEQKINIIHLM